MRSAIFAVLALASAAAFAADEQPAVRPRVSVSSQPSGATVSVDGMDRGVTPLVIYDLGPGRHHLRYRLAGGSCNLDFVDVGSVFPAGARKRHFHRGKRRRRLERENRFGGKLRNRLIAVV